jgi:hypothetical protein
MVLVGHRRVGFDFLFGIDTPAVWIQQVGVGDPKFHELEPDRYVAEGSSAFEVSRLTAMVDRP